MKSLLGRSGIPNACPARCRRRTRAPPISQTLARAPRVLPRFSQQPAVVQAPSKRQTRKSFVAGHARAAWVPAASRRPEPKGTDEHGDDRVPSEAPRPPGERRRGRSGCSTSQPVARSATGSDPEGNQDGREERTSRRGDVMSRGVAACEGGSCDRGGEPGRRRQTPSLCIPPWGSRAYVRGGERGADWYGG